MGLVGAFMCAALLLLCQDKVASKTQPGRKASVHTVITTECTPYFDWQILGLAYRSASSCSFTFSLQCKASSCFLGTQIMLFPLHSDFIHQFRAL